jgi:hypothetical protein
LDLSKVNNQDLGFLLPRVSLKNVTDWQLRGSSSDGAGMLVYNTNPNTTGGNGKAGVYIWTGAGGWEPLESNLSDAVQVSGFDLTPSSGSVDIYAGETVAFTADGDLCLALSDLGNPSAYTWDDAKTQCANLTTDGKAWRLPNIVETKAGVKYLFLSK